MTIAPNPEGLAFLFLYLSEDVTESVASLFGAKINSYSKWVNSNLEVKVHRNRMIHECQSWSERVFLFKIPSQGCPDLIFGAQSDFGYKRDLSKANMGIKATFTGGSERPNINH